MRKPEVARKDVLEQRVKVVFEGVGFKRPLTLTVTLLKLLVDFLLWFLFL